MSINRVPVWLRHNHHCHHQHHHNHHHQLTRMTSAIVLGLLLTRLKLRLLLRRRSRGGKISTLTNLNKRHYQIKNDNFDILWMIDTNTLKERKTTNLKFPTRPAQAPRQSPEAFMAIMSIMSSCNWETIRKLYSLKMQSFCDKFQNSWKLILRQSYMEKIIKNNFASNFLGKTESVSVIGGGEVVDNSTSLKNKTNKIDQDEQIRYIINK